MSSTLTPRSSLQLCGEMALLGQLGVVERLIGRFEIGAAVLLIGIQKQRVEPPVQIVVVGDIALRAPARIELLQMPKQEAQ